MKSKEDIPGLLRAVQVGERVFLRHPTGADRAAWVRLRDDSEAFLRPWEPTPPGIEEMLPSDVAFGRLMTTCDTRESQRYVICLREDGRIAGQISLNHIVRGPMQGATAGYWIGEAFSRQGYMREGLGLALRQAFEGLKLHRVEANIIPRNAASKALVKSLGFRFEGLAKRYLRINGAWEDHEHWAMTAEDWMDLRGRSARALRDGRARRSGSAARRASS
ncbi:MAG: GCN5 family N-acetyltransferase [Phycisphaerae bacterium]|nr:MAG: GCN5 family N-acetyltransferase [Phycisphaerae bacterium]